MMFIRPATTKVMNQRKVQGMMYGYHWAIGHTVDLLLLRNEGWKEVLRPSTTLERDAEVKPSKEIKNKLQWLLANIHEQAFGKLHGMSALVNLASLAATMWYGVTISERLQ